MLSADQLSIMISHAAAPAFLLTSVAAMVSILIARMTRITERIRDLNSIADHDTQRNWLKADIARLKRRERLLSRSLHLAVAGAVFIAMLLLFGFLAALFGYRHEPGAGVLFIVALCLLVGSLLLFLLDLRISLSDHDDHHHQ